MPQKSEFATLSDLAIKQGITHSELLSQIHDAILSEYKKLHPEKPETVDVVVDEKTGGVHIMRDGADITPEGFSPIAERVARESIIEKLSSIKDKKDVSESVKEKPSSLGKWVVNILFWGYNLLYVFILFVFLANFARNVDYRTEILETLRDMGVARSLFLVTAALVPLFSIFVAVKTLSKSAYEKLGTLFFLFEIPLVIVPLLLANIFPNPTPVI